jgi:DNA modification methylase
MTSQAANVEQVATTDLLPHPNNPRNGDVPSIVKSIETNGWFGTIVAQRSTGHVLAGNHRLLAAKEIGIEQVPVYWADVDDDTARRILLTDNRTSDLATYDDMALAEILSGVADTDIGLIGTGYDVDDLADILAQLDIPPTPSDPPIPDPVDDPITKPGDLILLGDHRLICGDATDPNTYTTLLDGNHADCVWTDPPYGVSYVGGTAENLTIENDDLNPEQLTKLITTAFDLTITHTKPGAAWFVAHPGGPLHLIFGQALNNLKVLRQQLIWVKNSLVMGRSDYHYQHEPIYYGWTPGAAHHEPRDRKQSTILEFNKPTANKEHPTMKPIALVEHLLLQSTDPGNLILDPFAGSGTTLLAADNLDRKAAAIELDPRYCDVIVTRWEQQTSQSATRPEL